MSSLQNNRANVLWYTLPPILYIHYVFTDIDVICVDACPQYMVTTFTREIYSNKDSKD